MRPANAGSTGTSRQQTAALALVLDDRLEQLLELVPALGLRGGRSTSQRRSGPAAGSSSDDDAAEERVGDLQQDPGTVARARVGPRGAAMLEVGERLERPPHGLVQGLRVESRDERDATRIVLVLGAVEALLGRAHAAHRVTPRQGVGIAGLENRGSTHTISPRLAVSSAGAVAKHPFKD